MTSILSSRAPQSAHSSYSAYTRKDTRCSGESSEIGFVKNRGQGVRGDWMINPRLARRKEKTRGSEYDTENVGKLIFDSFERAGAERPADLATPRPHKWG